MRALWKSALAAVAAPALMVGGCVAHQEVAGPGTPPPGPEARPGGAARWGSSISAMADQYSRPHAGPYSATGASAWVAPSPPPAYVDTSPPPPPTAEAAPPAAVRNRTPSAAAVADAADLARPEATLAAPAAPAPPAAARAAVVTKVSAADIAKGRTLFGANGCGGCHTLTDAGAAGVVGPGFDGNTGLTPAYVFNTVHDGRNSMPSFAGQIPDADIHTIANYIVAAKK